ncbi:hypothetical protein AJ78_08669, partial [Emergomyces pasteurianus Ep9510]
QQEHSRSYSSALAENKDKRTLYGNEMSFEHIGNDGISRIFNEAGEVVGYTRLTRDQLLAEVATSPLTEQEKKHQIQLWNKIDSSQVSIQQIYHPSEDLLPPMMADSEGSSLELEISKQQIANVLVPRTPRGWQDRCKKIRCVSSSACWEEKCFACKKVGRNILGYCG